MEQSSSKATTYTLKLKKGGGGARQVYIWENNGIYFKLGSSASFHTH